MAIKEITLNRIPAQDSVLYINKSGISFSANFIKKEKLQEAKGVKFFEDDEDPYYLGFKFKNDLEESNTLSLMASGRSKGGSAGFTIKASELINKNPILKNIQKMTSRQDRTFEIFYEKKTNIYSILLRPNFEIIVKFSDRNTIPDAFKGIYRYRNNDGQIIYIGKGGIKTRVNSPERKEWGISKIEYSVLLDDDISYYWENYYLERYVSTFGSKPPFNVIMGKSE
jgi:plasmid maintenance system killer protein